MSKSEVDAYLNGVAAVQRATLEDLRSRLLKLIPGGEEAMSYAMPCIKLHGKAVAGYAAWKNHLAYYPHSGQVVPKLEKLLEGRTLSTGGFHFQNDERLSDELLEALVNAKLDILREKYPSLRF